MPPPHPFWPYRRRTDALVKKPDLAPWPAPGAARGPLAWSDDELADVIRDNHIAFPGPTAEFEPQPEARLEALNEAVESGVIEAVIEAIESGALRRKKPGRRPGEQPQRREDYLALYRECLSENAGNIGLADTEFVRRATAKFNVAKPSARNRLSEVKKILSPDFL